MDNDNSKYRRAFDICTNTYLKYERYKYSDFYQTRFIASKNKLDHNSYVSNFGLINDEHKLFWVKIPKCAHTYMDRHLSKHMLWRPADLNSDYDKITRDYRGIVILRNPFERWISGATTFVNRYSEYKKIQGIDFDDYQNDIRELKKYFGKKTIIKDIFVDWMINNMLFDFHGLPQSWYLYPTNLNNCTFFYMHDKLGSDLNKYFKSLGISNTFINVKLNPTPPNEAVNVFFEDFLDDKSNADQKTKIMNILACDYELIELLTFYNK
jgi:hypothetical protein